MGWAYLYRTVMPSHPIRSALVHDFFVAQGGAEACAIELASLLPGAEVHTSFFHDGRFAASIRPDRVRMWPLQRLLGPTERFRSLLPLYPVWFSLLDLRSADLVVSSSIAFTHAVRTRKGALHISYVYTPMRYAWDLDTYLTGSSLGTTSRIAARTLQPMLRRWDQMTAGRPDELVAISETVRERIKRLWGRESELIYPAVETAQIPVSSEDDGYLLVAARMLAYRRLDLAVAAATRLGRELMVVGDGPERARLESIGGPTVHFLGRVDRPTLIDLFARCSAYIVPGIEDFGIAPVEAMAAGKPVIGIRAGGVAETVIDGETGVLFDEPDVRSVVEAIEQLDGLTLDPGVIRRRAEAFDTAVFRQRWRELFARLGVDPSLYSRE
jgi:glycosyltransferase involved in cell wall biosynthesis